MAAPQDNVNLSLADSLPAEETYQPQETREVTLPLPPLPEPTEQETREQPSSTEAHSSQEMSRPLVLHLSGPSSPSEVSFQPAAYFELTPSLRTSGLLLALSGEEVKSLLMLLTFLTPNGYCTPSVVELCQALHLSDHALHSRMRRLTEFVWQGKPLVHLLERESGLDAYAVSEHLWSIVEDASPPVQPIQPPLQAAGRDAVIAYSRAHYARPREEVEREIAQLNGWPYPPMSLAESQATGLEPAERQESGDENAPELPEVADMRRRLLAIGVTQEQADWLLARFDLERIRQQIGWLPYRHAKHPAAFLLAAIEQDYEAPHGFRAPVESEQTQTNPEEASPQLGGDIQSTGISSSEQISNTQP